MGFMKSRYIVSYDICNPKRLRKVHKAMKGFGDPLQYSVFCCDLSSSQKVLLIEAMTELINHHEDQVLLINIGPAEGRGRESIESIGLAFNPERLERRSVII